MTARQIIELRRNGSILAGGREVGRFQRLTIGGYEVVVLGQKLGANYYADIRRTVDATLISMAYETEADFLAGYRA